MSGSNQNLYYFLKIVDKSTVNTKNGDKEKWTVLFEEIDGYKDKLCLETWDPAVIDVIRHTAANTTVAIDYKAKSREYGQKWYHDLRLISFRPLTKSKGDQVYDLDNYRNNPLQDHNVSSKPSDDDLLDLLP